MRFIVLLLAMLAVGVLNGTDYRIVSARDGKTYTLKTMAKELSKYDLVFFGEFHDNATIHQLQAEILPLLEGKKELILSFEMFERDVQDALDSYLQNKIDEAEFMEASRPWGNYQTDYRPLIEYAKARNKQVIAANVPRIYAGKMARMGAEFKETLSDEELNWISREFYYPNDAYKEAFFEVMGVNSSGAHGMMNDALSLEWLYQAQCLKDDTMAESIVMAHIANPKARIMHFNGAFHSSSFLGTVSRVQRALPKLKIAVINPIYRSDWDKVQLSKEDRQTGTFILLLPEQIEEDEL